MEKSALVIGIDFLLSRLKEQKCNKLVINSLATQLPFKSDIFDKVVFKDVLEHVPKVAEKKIMSEILRVLRPGGVLFLDYPENILADGLLYLFNVPLAFLKYIGLFKDRRYYRWKEPDAHVNFKTPWELNNLIKDSGFEGFAYPDNRYMLFFISRLVPYIPLL